MDLSQPVRYQIKYIKFPAFNISQATSHRDIQYIHMQWASGLSAITMWTYNKPSGSKVVMHTICILQYNVTITTIIHLSTCRNKTYLGLYQRINRPQQISQTSQYINRSFHYILIIRFDMWCVDSKYHSNIQMTPISKIRHGRVVHIDKDISY